MLEVADGKKTGLIIRRCRWWLAVFSVAVLVWGWWAWWTDQSYRDAILQIELRMANGQYVMAARSLRNILARWPDCGEAAILLARCEQERGRKEAAARALARVGPGSVFSHKAILGRMRLAHDQGHLAVAEQIVADAAADPGNDRSHTRFLLVPIFSQLGRIDEAERLIEERWERLNETGEGASEPAIDLVRMHIQLAFTPNTVEDARAYLETAAGLDPDDDRVWLGRANLAMRTGAYDEAKRWLDACLTRRPQDVPVWRVCLNWGMATNQLEIVRRALKHLPNEEFTIRQAHRLKAWLAANRADLSLERQELEHLLAEDPADRMALDRLAQLAEKAGQPAQASELLRRKTEIDHLRARYKKLYDRNQPLRDAEEMAGLAERLGRTFEARGFLTVAISDEPDRDDLRQNLRRLTSQGSRRPVGPGRTLAEFIGSL